MSDIEHLSTVDAAWLHMDAPSNLAIITGIFMFDKPLDFARVRTTLEQRILRVRRFRERVREGTLGLGLPQWEPDPHFNLDAHLFRVHLPRPGDQAALEKFVGDLMSQPLERDKPLWEMYVVENYGRGSALVSRLHHCMGDGLALVRVILMLTDAEPNATWSPPRGKYELPSSHLVDVHSHAGTAIGGVVHETEKLAHEGMETLIHPERLREAAKFSAAGVRALLKLLLILPDHPSMLKGKCGVPKRAAWSKPIPLEKVKGVGHALDATVNDVLLAAVTGALRRYLEAKRQPTEGLTVRSIVPVNLRPPDKPLDLDKLGNQFGLVFLTLPVGIRNPHERLAALKQNMEEIKHSPEALVAFGILNVMGGTPSEVEKIITTIFGWKGTAVMTNVPGPRETLYFAGQMVRDAMFWVPHPANLGLGVSILSYAGKVYVGIASDAGLIPDPAAIVDSFHLEFNSLSRAVARAQKPAARVRATARRAQPSRAASGPKPKRVGAIKSG